MTFLYVMFLHWIADFVCQTDKQAKNKSSDNLALLAHVATYSVVMTLGIAPLFLLTSSFAETLRLSYFLLFLIGLPHFATDYVTSRVNTFLWKKQRVHDFFVSVGFDQFIHYVCLYVALHWLDIV